MRQNKAVGVRMGLTIVEMVIAMAIMAVIFAAVLPALRAIQNSWDSKAGDSEILQNGRVLVDHLYRNLSKALKITAVSNSDDTNGYIEFRDIDGNVLRYDIHANSFVEFGSAGELSELAGPVSQLQFTCYDAYDLDNPLDMDTADVNDVRSVRIQAVLPNASSLGQDKTVSAWIFIRANPNLESDNIDLVGWWKLDESSGTSASDSSGNGNHGTLVNMNQWSDWVTGQVGGALDFDGWNDYVMVPDDSSFDIADQITAAAWINPGDAWNWRTIASKLAHTYSCRLDLYWFLYHNKIGASLAGPCSSWYYWTPNVQISTNVWTHVALTYDGAAMRMYKNGVCEDTLTASGNLSLANSSSDEPFYIGRNSEWGEYFSGRIDDVRIYSRALNASEIEAFCSEAAYLVAYWKLDETSGGTAHDTSSNGNDGTLYNMENGDWVTGHVEGALKFNGSDEYVRVYDDSSFDIADKITLAAWINPDNASSWRTIASKFAHTPSCRKDLYWFLYNNKIGACLAGPCSGNWTPNVSISTGTWTHVALTYDGAAMKMYKNGACAATTSASGALMLAQFSSNESFYLGRNSEWSQYYDGKLDEVSIYNCALTDGQVELLYNGQQIDWSDDEQILP
jgi:hypothetical protein